MRVYFKFFWKRPAGVWEFAALLLTAVLFSPAVNASESDDSEDCLFSEDSFNRLEAESQERNRQTSRGSIWREVDFADHYRLLASQLTVCNSDTDVSRMARQSLALYLKYLSRPPHRFRRSLTLTQLEAHVCRIWELTGKEPEDDRLLRSCLEKIAALRRGPQQNESYCRSLCVVL